MVPYVRKSFANICVWFEFVEEVSELLLKRCPSLDLSEMSIEIIREKAYKYAYEMTSAKVYQAVEAMYHNLFNTLQSRVGLTSFPLHLKLRNLTLTRRPHGNQPATRCIYQRHRRAA